MNGLLDRALQTAEPEEWPELAIRYALPKLSPRQIAQMLTQCLDERKVGEVLAYITRD